MKTYYIYFLFTDPCKTSECTFYSSCVVTHHLKPQCVCPVCPNDVKYQPVCGNNGRTYATVCQMQVESCLLKRNIEVVKNGPCRKSFFFNLLLN